MITVSPLARRAKRMRQSQPRGAGLWGVCLHTTGEDVSSIAGRTKQKAIDVAERIYLDPDMYFPHYVSSRGEHVAIADELVKAQHVGRITEGGVDRREQYMSGEWLAIAPPEAVRQWRKAWPGRAHPFSLFPSQSPNRDYVGIEIPPIYPTPDDFVSPRFTAEDLEGAARLAVDVARRWSFPDQWWTTSRLVGHEDVGLLDRCDKGGGWDPGALREHPYFDMAWVRRRCGELWVGGT